MFRDTQKARPKGPDAGAMQPVAGLLLVAFAYLAADLLMNKVALGSDGWTILWPLNGITIALLLRAPRRRWLWLLLAIETGTFAGELLDANGLQLALVERSCSIAEVLLSAMVLPAFTSMDTWLEDPWIVQRVVLALAAAPGLTGLPYALYVHLHDGQNFLAAWFTWGPPDMLGNAVTLPVVLACFAPEMRRLLARDRIVQTATLLLATCAVSLAIFTHPEYPLLFLLYPLLLYVDTRLAFAGSSLAIFLTALLGVFCTVHGYGPFGRWSTELRVSGAAALQIFLGFHAVALLPLSLVILERKKISLQLLLANSRLEQLSQQDALTGIANRRCFDQNFEREWNAPFDADAALSLLMIDIDHFKRYNDRYGHVEGDECLRRVADVLAEVAARHHAFAARLGGEEFAILLPVHAASSCSQVAEDLCAAVQAREMPHEGNSWGTVSVSIGCARRTAATATTVDLMACADEALYRAKTNGRNRWECAYRGQAAASSLIPPPFGCGMPDAA